MRNEAKDFGLHLVFLFLLIFSTSTKRSIIEANAVYNAMETIFIDEEFGDFNEKAFMDVSNFEEVWEWMDSVLAPGLFESDVDDTGNIMMYNQLVGGCDAARRIESSNEPCVRDCAAY